MTNTPIHALPCIEPSQAQKHVTHNEALRQLDVLTQLSVDSRTETAPPATPGIGDRYIVAAPATDAFAGHENDIAVYEETGWRFVTPQEGWTAVDRSLGGLLVFGSGGWVGLQPPDLNNLAAVGINTTADSAGRLAVAADRSVFTHDGADHQVVVNKSSATDTASLLFQNNWIGHAEMGLAGETNFSIKVSADGTNWNTTMVADAATGTVSFPNGGVRRVMPSDTTWYVDPIAGSDSNDGLSPGTGAFATIQKAVDTIMTIDAGGNTATIQLADGNYPLSQPVVINQAVLGASAFNITGNIANPDQVTISSPEAVFDMKQTAVTVTGVTLSTSGTNESCFELWDNSFLYFGNLRFGTATRSHVYIINSTAVAIADYEIIDGAKRHFQLDHQGSLRAYGYTVTLTGTPAFPIGFVAASNASSVGISGITFAGAATGRRYAIYGVAIVNTGGSGTSYFPGDVNGVTGSNGTYA